jgi:hypothetical protein
VGEGGLHRQDTEVAKEEMGDRGLWMGPWLARLAPGRCRGVSPRFPAFPRGEKMNHGLPGFTD